MADEFEDLVQRWGQAACDEWGYPEPPSDWIGIIKRRLPPGLGAAVADGIESGSIIVVDEHRFTLRGLESGKGPYAWFSRNQTQVPAPNWEYFVQAAEFVRLKTELEPKGYSVQFEDELMDISVYAGGDLVVGFEVKERASQLGPLLKGIESHGKGVDLTSPDRANDPLRKAKYLVRRRPKYFGLSAIGSQMEFAVTYPAENSFELREDLIWLP